MEIKVIDINQIVSGPNVRNERDETILELAASIEKDGLMNPITVRFIGNGKYEIVAGHRRYEAMKYLNEPYIECNVIICTDKDRLIYQLSENIQRKNMSAYEYVEVFEQIKKSNPAINTSQLAKMFHKSYDWVASQYSAVKILEAQYRTGNMDTPVVIPEEEKKKSAAVIKAEYRRRVIKDESEILDCEGMTVRRKGHTYQIYCYSFDAEESLKKLLNSRR